MAISAMFAIANLKALAVLFPAGEYSDLNIDSRGHVQGGAGGAWAPPLFEIY